MQVNFRLHVKSESGQNWRQVIALNKLDFCGIAKGTNLIPTIKTSYDELIVLFPSVPLKCPILPGKYSALNATIVEDYSEKSFLETPEEYKTRLRVTNVEKKTMDFITPSVMPNGVYRVTLRFYNDMDPIGAAFYWQYFIRLRMNEERL